MYFKCCKNCTDRKVGCHGYCEKYIKDKIEYDKVKMLNENNRAINSYEICSRVNSTMVDKKRERYPSSANRWSCV